MITARLNKVAFCSAISWSHSMATRSTTQRNCNCSWSATAWASLFPSKSFAAMPCRRFRLPLVSANREQVQKNMTQTTNNFTATSSFPLPDAFSAALTAIFDRVKPSVVQVHTEGRGGGTGIIWHQDGRILTNNHVVARDDAKVQILLSDGRTLPARVLYRNQQLDLALLKAEGDALQPLLAGDSTQLRVGEWVFALGHPWGQ